MIRHVLFWIGLICLLIGAAPALSVLISSGIADANGCALNEGSVNPCVIGGQDIGGLLGGMFVMGWLFLLTWPFALAGLGLLIALGIATLIRRLR